MSKASGQGRRRKNKANCLNKTLPLAPESKAQSSRPSPIQQTVQRPDPPRRRVLKLGGSLFLAALSVGGFAMMAWPNVHVLPPTDPADPLQPYAVEFSIQNSGTLPIYDVEVQCIPYRFRAKVKRSEKTAPGPAVGNRRFIADTIPSGESRRFLCDVIKLPQDSVISAIYADAVTLVRFRPISVIPLSWPVKTQASSFPLNLAEN
jgi:hypothetical protein